MMGFAASLSDFLDERMAFLDRMVATGKAPSRVGLVAAEVERERRRQAADQDTQILGRQRSADDLDDDMVRWAGAHFMVEDFRLEADEAEGVGPIVAARVLADVGDVAGFVDRNRFASWTGTAPIAASSGEIVRHRLSRAGNRRMNHMIHIAATTQIHLTRRSGPTSCASSRPARRRPRGCAA